MKVYEPVSPIPGYYAERVNRNFFWITEEEQKVIQNTKVGIAGNGGMGGLLGAVLLRAGFGEIRIADNQSFDLSNLNRQFAARKDTIGKSKALETAEELRRITDDTKIVVYPEGITPDTVDSFVQDCDLIFDELELFAASARILLHQKARGAGISLLNCNVVGFGTRLFLFTPEGMTIEELLGLSCEEAKELENLAQGGSREAIGDLVNRLLKGLVPELPEYKVGDVKLAIKRLLEERKAPIFATQPPLSTGFVANRAVLHLLQRAGFEKRDIPGIPKMPGYLYFDAAFMQAKIVQGRWT